MGDPRKRKGGRVTPKIVPCPVLSRGLTRRECKKTSSIKVGDGPKRPMCSWCGKIG